MHPADAAWLGMDAPDNLMMVTAVLRLNREVARAELLEVLQQRLVARYPTFSMCARPARWPLRRAHWQDDPAFALSGHVVDAGLVEGDAGLAALVSELLGRPLPMARPPWQFHLVSLVGEGGRRTSVLVARLHHCLADGVALAGVLHSLTDGEPAGAVRPGAPEPSGHPVRRAVAAAGFGVVVVRTVAQLLLATRDPRTRLSGRLGTAKVAAWSQPMDLAVVKRVAKALDATVNDVLLAVIAGALRAHLTENGDRAHDLRVFVPVDLRPPGAAVPTSLGNRFGMVFVRLPVSVADPLARVRAVHQRMSRRKASAQAAATFAVLTVVGALPAWAHRLAVRVLGSKSSAVVTNVVGPARPLRLAGARLTRLGFWVPQAGSVGLGVSIVSYAGELTVGVAADRNLVPEPARLAAAVEDGLAELTGRALGVAQDCVVLEEVPIDSEPAATLVAEVQQEYLRRYGVTDATPVDQREFAPPYGVFLLARVGPTVLGCAGMRQHTDGVVELKRMYVRPEHRRRGHARRLLAALEQRAREQGSRRMVLETGTAQPEAIALYTSSGYTPVPGFGYHRDVPLARSFGRDL